jgi:CelD/BcsL family acetyltransferase involved in cellulose biosynthesis
MKSCGASYFSFNHLPLTQTVFAPFVRFHNVSPILELQGGWDAYVQRLANIQNTKSPGILGAIKKSSKRLERDLGPLRFEMHERDPRVLNELMRLKSEQWIRTVGAGEDAFAIAWVRQLMLDTLATQTADFSGYLCALYAGEKLISIYFGMRTGTTLHSWFLVYDLEQAYYQPGLILLKNLAESACQDGLNVIDLGRGTQDYKMRFNTQVVELGEGVVSRPAILAQSTIAAKQLKAKIKANPQIVQLRKWMSAQKK